MILTYLEDEIKRLSQRYADGMKRNMLNSGTRDPMKKDSRLL